MATATHARIWQWRKHAWQGVQRWRQHWPAASCMPRCKCNASWTWPHECWLLLPISILSFGASWMNHNLAGRKLENLFQPVCSITKPMAVVWVSACRLTCETQYRESMHCSFCLLVRIATSDGLCYDSHAMIITLCRARLFFSAPYSCNRLCCAPWTKLLTDFRTTQKDVLLVLLR